MIRSFSLAIILQQNIENIKKNIIIVLILDGNLEIVEKSIILYLRHSDSIRSKAVTNQIFTLKRPIFLNACAARRYVVTINVSAMDRI